MGRGKSFVQPGPFIGPVILECALAEAIPFSRGTGEGSVAFETGRSLVRGPVGIFVGRLSLRSQSA